MASNPQGGEAWGCPEPAGGFHPYQAFLEAVSLLFSSSGAQLLLVHRYHLSCTPWQVCARFTSLSLLPIKHFLSFSRSSRTCGSLWGSNRWPNQRLSFSLPLSSRSSGFSPPSPGSCNACGLLRILGAHGTPLPELVLSTKVVTVPEGNSHPAGFSLTLKYNWVPSSRTAALFSHRLVSPQFFYQLKKEQLSHILQKCP